MKAKKILTTILDIIELYIPIAAFCVLFITFIWAIFTRYILNEPCNWATDVELGCYIWIILLSASYVMRKDKHVRFTIVYDMCGEKLQTAMRLVSNLLIVVPFAFLLKPTWVYLTGLRTVSPALQLPLKYYYFPIIWFIGSVIVNAAVLFVRDLLAVLRRAGPPKKEDEA